MTAQLGRHDADVGLQFLRWLYPFGPWVMTAIDPTQQDLWTQTFLPESADRFGKWLEEHATHNVYYHVNRPTRHLTKKAERTDIAEMCYLHVDVDPRDREDFDREKARIHGLFTTSLPSGLPKPSAVIYSGGGYNALWRLKQALPIATNGVSDAEALALAEDAKRYNLQLEILLGGDNCHNIDRILRLPGTTNWPNKKKLAKGRKPTLAEIVYLTDDSYDIGRFLAAAPVQQRGEHTVAGGVRVHVSGNVKRLGSVAELPDRVTDRTKMIIVQGNDPDEPTKFGGSRSEWLFHVCCELVRAGVDDDTIYGVITDPAFLISASVLEKGSSTERYALRQIQRAREDAISPELRKLNERHWVVGNMGGKCRVMEEIIDYAMSRPLLTTQSFEDFRNRYMNQRVKVGENPKTNEPTYQALGQWWLHHKDRRQYDNVVFSPGREIPGAYNMWRGFAYEAKPGDKHEIFLKHMLDVVCDGSKLNYEYLVRWMARAVQHPDTQGEVCVVFRGDPGIGKSTVAKIFGALWGRHYLMVSDPKHLVGSFNAHLQDAVVVFADEAFYAGDKKHESILKTLITEDTLTIEAKGRDVVTSRNYVHLLMASNSSWVVPANLNERRYLVLDVNRLKMRNFEYFSRLYKTMTDGGYENLLYYLLTLPIADFEVRDVPATEGLREQKLLSLNSEQEWWYQKLLDGRLTKRHVSWEAPCWKDELMDDYLLYSQKLGVQRRANATALGRFIHSVMPAGWPQTKQLTKQYTNDEGVRMNERAYAYHFPPLDECRTHWDKKFGGPYDWPTDGESKSEQVDAF